MLHKFPLVGIFSTVHVQKGTLINIVDFSFENGLNPEAKKIDSAMKFLLWSILIISFPDPVDSDDCGPLFAVGDTHQFSKPLLVLSSIFECCHKLVQCILYYAQTSRIVHL